MESIKKVEWENKITRIQENILKQLAHYKFLTIKQLLHLGVGTKNYPYLWRQIASLRDRKKPFVCCDSFSDPRPDMGKAESVYYLNSNGKNVLINEFEMEEEDIRYKVGNHLTASQHYHRLYCVEYQMALDKWLDNNDLYTNNYLTYMDTTGSSKSEQGLKKKTKIEMGASHIIPDGAYKVENENKESVLHLFELCNGKETKRIVSQLHKHAQAMAFGFAADHFQISRSKPYKVVIVFTHRSALKGVIAKILKDEKFSAIYSHFICKEIEVEKDKTGKPIEGRMRYIRDDYGEVASFISA